MSRSRGAGGTTAAAAASAEKPNGRDDVPVDRPHRPRREMAMALLLPDSRPPMGLDQLQTQMDDRRGGSSPSARRCGARCGRGAWC